MMRSLMSFGATLFCLAIPLMLLPMTKSAVIFAFLYVNTAYVMLFKYTNNYTFYNFFVIHPTFSIQYNMAQNVQDTLLEIYLKDSVSPYYINERCDALSTKIKIPAHAGKIQ